MAKEKFFVNYIDKIKIKIISNIKIMCLFKNYLPQLVFTKLDNYDYELKIIDNLPEISIPSDAKLLSAFAASDYYVWKDQSIHKCFTYGNKYAKPHYIEKEENVISLFFDNNDNLEISIKVLREI